MMITISAVIRNISHDAKMAILKGILLGSVTILAYIIIVIVTTPELPASFAIKAAFFINPIIIYGTAFGVGVNTFISSLLPALCNFLISSISELVSSFNLSTIADLIVSECEVFPLVTYWTIFVLPPFQVENDSAISANPYIFYHANRM